MSRLWPLTEGNRALRGKEVVLLFCAKCFAVQITTVCGPDIQILAVDLCAFYMLQIAAIFSAVFCNVAHYTNTKKVSLYLLLKMVQYPMLLKLVLLRMIVF